MEANSTHISLETAKLLKDCEIESRYFYTTNDGILDTNNFVNIADSFDSDFKRTFINNYYPAYTWQEILWEYPERFFWGKNFSYDAEYDNEWANGNFIVFRLLQLLQQKEYDEADEYFRENCILIKK